MCVISLPSYIHFSLTRGKNKKRVFLGLPIVYLVVLSDVDDEDHVGKSLLQIWELRFGLTAKLWFRL